jgi:CHAD domain-containing protein
MAEAKWIPDLRADTPARHAAKHVLELRLSVVQERLPLAAAHADEDVEHVHQLRVGTRRAGAALRIFAAVLPTSLHKKLRKTLKKLRQAAGAARDWDVFIDTLTQRLNRVEAKQRRGLDFLLGFSHGQRVVAQQGLIDVAEAKGEDLAELSKDLPAALQNDDDRGPTLRQLAVPSLTELLHELDSAAAGDLSQYEHLHQVRIQGKHLRYAMEVFESCFAPEFREQIYPKVTEMQDILGLANDSHVATHRLENLRLRLLRTQPEQWPAYQPGIGALLRFHQRRLPQQRRAFLAWWYNWQESGTEHELTRLICSGE